MRRARVWSGSNGPTARTPRSIRRSEPGFARSTFDPPDVAIGGALHRGRAVAVDHPVPPTAIHAVEAVRPHGRGDPFDGRCRQRNFIGIASHEADEAPVGGPGQGVPGEQPPTALGPSGPVESGAAFEVAAALNQGEPGDGGDRPLPVADRRVEPHDPLPVCLRDEDGRVAEGLAPLDADAVKMRMRHRDAAQSTSVANGGDPGVVDKSQAVPEDVAFGGLYQQCPLADPNRWIRADPGQPGFELADVGAAALRLELRKGYPALSTRRDVLTLVLADRAVRWWLRAGGVLHAAGAANVGGHAVKCRPTPQVTAAMPRKSRQIVEGRLRLIGKIGRAHV